jgi:hypothetical protein
VKRLAASAASWFLGMVGWWCLEWQARVIEWGMGSAPGDDFYRWGGTD